MSAATVYVIRSQAGQFLSRQLEWVDAHDGPALYRTVHRDEAVNTVFEVSARDIHLRAEAVACPLDGKGQPAPQQIAPRPAAAPGDEPAARAAGTADAAP